MRLRLRAVAASTGCAGAAKAPQPELAQPVVVLHVGDRCSTALRRRRERRSLGLPWRARTRSWGERHEPRASSRSCSSDRWGTPRGRAGRRGGAGRARGAAPRCSPRTRCGRPPPARSRPPPRRAPSGHAGCRTLLHRTLEHRAQQAALAEAAVAALRVRGVVGRPPLEPTPAPGSWRPAGADVPLLEPDRRAALRCRVPAGETVDPVGAGRLGVGVGARAPAVVRARSARASST